MKFLSDIAWVPLAVVVLGATTIRAAMMPHLTVWQTWDSSGERILPSTPPPAMGRGAFLRVVSVQDARAVASFAIHSDLPVQEFRLLPSELKTEEGHTIPAETIDLRVVKCWYQDANGWFMEKRAPGASVLVPELLLHDDSLVLVDEKTKANLVRTSPAGAKTVYRRIEAAKGGDVVPPRKGFVAADDAKTLLPLPLAGNQTRQFHMALAVGGTTPPGLYRGWIDLVADGQTAGRIDISLRVLDHLLPAPFSRFSIHADLDGEKVPTGEAPAVLSIEPMPYRSIIALPPSRLTPETLSFLIKAGATDPVIPPSAITRWKDLFAGKAPPSLWIADQAALSGTARATPPRETALALAVEAKKTGIDDIHLFLPSRPSGEGLAEDAKIFEDVDDIDVQVWTDAGDETYAKAAALIRSPMARGLPPVSSSWRFNKKVHGSDYDTGYFDNYEYTDTRPVERWHKIGVPFYLCSMASPAVEDPSIWRRRFGAECYYHGYDGVVIPMVQETIDPWNDWASPEHRSRTFLYPTENGYVETLAWNAISEGFLDARYLTSVRILIREIRLKGLDSPLFDLEGRRASMWFDALHVQRCDLDTMRLDAIAWIDKLQRCLELAADGPSDQKTGGAS